MLTIDLKINGRLIGSASAWNASEGAAVSNYDVTAYTEESQFAPGTSQQFRVRDHDRHQTPWALVEKIARAMSET